MADKTIDELCASLVEKRKAAQGGGAKPLPNSKEGQDDRT